MFFAGIWREWVSTPMRPRFCYWMTQPGRCGVLGVGAMSSAAATPGLLKIVVVGTKRDAA